MHCDPRRSCGSFSQRSAVSQLSFCCASWLLASMLLEFQFQFQFRFYQGEALMWIASLTLRVQDPAQPVDLIARWRLAVCSRNVAINILSDYIVRQTIILHLFFWSNLVPGVSYLSAPWSEKGGQKDERRDGNEAASKNRWPQWALSLSLRYGHVILVSRYLALTRVNWPYHGFSKKDAIKQGCMSLSSC